MSSMRLRCLIGAQSISLSSRPKLWYNGMVCHVISKIINDASIPRESTFPIQEQNRMLYDEAKPMSMPCACMIRKSIKWKSWRTKQTLLEDRVVDGQFQVGKSEAFYKLSQMDSDLNTVRDLPADVAGHLIET